MTLSIVADNDIITHIVDSTDKVARYSYSTYGKRTTEYGDDTNSSSLGYCAREGVLTETNGLIYMRARYYSPDLKRFINQDILVGDIGNSASLNRYTYVNGNPATNIDPFGLCGGRVGSEGVDNVLCNSESKLVYISYISGDDGFDSQAQAKNSKLLKQGYTVVSVDLTKEAKSNQLQDVISSEKDVASEFMRQWNDEMPDEVFKVYIYVHGSERMLQFEEGSRYNALTINGKNKASESVAGSIYDLSEKKIEELYLYACNTGHIDALNDPNNEYTNPAQILSEKVDGTVYAWDGSVSYGKIVKEPRLSYSQNHFNELISDVGYPKRKPIGEVIYQNGEYIGSR